MILNLQNTPIQKFMNRTSQPNFDKEQIHIWRKGAEEYYSKFKGVRYMGTYILKRSLVTYIGSEQVRQLKIIMENVPALKKAFLNEIDYNQQPPSVEKMVGTDDSVNEYHGRSGWTRDLAFDQLGWTHYFYDVLEFDSPRYRRRYMSATNSIKTPATGNTSGDIFRIISLMIEEKEIEPTEEMIREEVEALYVEGDDEDRDTMVEELKTTAGIRIGHYRTFHSKKGKNSTQEWAEQNNCPHGGNQNKKLPNRVGYIMHSPNAMGTWLNMIVKAYEKSVELGYRVHSEARAYIKNLKPADFVQDRKTFETTREGTKEKLENVIRHCIVVDDNGDVVRDKDGKIQIDLGVEWKGFLPQDETPNPTNGGLPMELGEVDYLGNPMKKDNE